MHAHDRPWCRGVFSNCWLCVGSREPKVRPSGQEATRKTEALKFGAKLLQKDSPLDPINVYLVGFHPIKSDPGHQMEAHHFCKQINEDFAQCVLFDGNTSAAISLGSLAPPGKSLSRVPH
jgi:hypothetical protein